jgi:predicted tellurium resistance membrane protein TerC
LLIGLLVYGGCKLWNASESHHTAGMKGGMASLFIMVLGVSIDAAPLAFTYTNVVEVSVLANIIASILFVSLMDVVEELMNELPKLPRALAWMLFLSAGKMTLDSLHVTIPFMDFIPSLPVVFALIPLVARKFIPQISIGRQAQVAYAADDDEQQRGEYPQKGDHTQERSLPGMAGRGISSPPGHPNK